jgi:peptidyl-prolyl cis-trans isomerase SurA
VVWYLFAGVCGLVACGGGEPADPVLPAPAEAPEPEPEPLPPPTEARYAATHVLVAWAGAARAPEGVTRSEEEAEALASSIRERALAGESLEALARTHSDGASAPRGGGLGVYDTGTMMPEFEAAVASVDVGGIGPLVRTAYGFHVVRRDAVREIRLRHVLVPFAGAWRSDATRSEEEARARAAEARAALDAGQPFEQVARTFGEDATAAHGGDLGTVVPGQLVPDFEVAAFDLEVGGVTGPVKTPYGFHVIQRVE